MRPDLLLLNDSAVGEAARALYLSGISVLPCRPGRKEPITPRGCLDAMSCVGTDPSVAAEYAESMLCATEAGWNIGIATGIEVDVLDVDIKDGRPGLAALRRLHAEGLLSGAVAYAQTPSGGRHVYFPTSGTRSGSVASLGLDWKARGGYVLAPPSRLASMQTVPGNRHTSTWQSNRYEWLWARPITAGEPFDWVSCKGLFGLPSRPPTRRRSAGVLEGADTGDAVGRLAAWLVRGSASLERNNALHWAACRAIESGAESEQQLAPLVAASLTLSRPGENRDREVRATVRSALKHYGLVDS